MSDLENLKNLVLGLSTDERKQFATWYAQLEDGFQVNESRPAYNAANTNAFPRSSRPDGRGVSEVAERADRIYDELIRPVVEPDMIGKIVTIDVDSGDYEVADNILPASHKLKERRPNGNFFSKRIGYDAVYAFGGATLRRTSK